MPFLGAVLRCVTHHCLNGYDLQDSRLLADIHVALVKTMVKDIVDAAHAVAGGTVGQRDAIAMAAGGHPQLVESVSRKPQTNQSKST